MGQRARTERGGAHTQAPRTAPAPAFRGADRFDEPRTLAELRDLEAEVMAVAARVRPTVVLLQSRGLRGGMASGTGVIIRPDGLVATCGHVGVRAGRLVEAVLADGTVLRGRTLGQVFEGGVDVGLVQLETEGRVLPSAEVGTTVGLAKGDWLLAFGHTHGSGEEGRAPLLRVGRVLGTAPHELMMDAPIDSGDSGGPSFNLNGEVVGLNSRCGRQSWENVAAPIDDLVGRMPELLADTGEDVRDFTAGRRRRGAVTNFPSGAGDTGKLAVQRLVSLGPVAEGARHSLLRVFVAGKQVAYGTVVDARGLALTKASQVRGDERIDIETPDRQRYRARVAARDTASDTALLIIEGAAPGELVSVAWAPEVAVTPGMALVTPRVKPDGAAFGFTAIEARMSERDATTRPFLGVRSEAADEDTLAAAAAEAGLLVRQVVDGSEAARAGIQTGDLLLSFAGEPLRTPEQLRRLISRLHIGDSVSMAVATADGQRTLHITLGARPLAAGGVRRGNTSTPISHVSSGLGEVLPHDAILPPEHMGGPVVDLEGRVVGINIARFDRTATHAIPAARAKELVQALIEQARQERESAKSSAAQ